MTNAKLLLFFLFFTIISHSIIANPTSKLSVAAIQFKPLGSVEKNTGIVINYLKQCAEQDIRVAVFQECALTGYDKGVIKQSTEKHLLDAEKKIAEACKTLGMYAVVGTPFYDGDRKLNTALIINPDGETVARYAKIQLVGGDDWAEPGEQMVVFPVDGIPCSVIICHDERYPELVRLPVLAGARVVFYISSESPVTAEHKLDPYRAQIQARADENDVFIIQANEPAMASHGQSRIIRPDGNIIIEAGIFSDEMITAVIDTSKASGGTAKNSLRFNELKAWWEEGMKMVKVIE